MDNPIKMQARCHHGHCRPPVATATHCVKCAARTLLHLLSLMAMALGGVTVSARDCVDVLAQAARRSAVDAWLHGERLPGVAITTNLYRLSAARGGRIVSISARAGVAVASGTPLLQLHSDELERALHATSSEQHVMLAEVSAQHADVERLERERARRQAHPQLFAREEREAHDALLKSARARLDSAQARSLEVTGRAQVLQNEQHALRLLAPHSGLVGTVFVRAGEVVPDGAPLIEFSTPIDTIFRFAVPARHVAALHVDDLVCVAPTDASAAPVSARVLSVSAEVTRNAQVFTAEAVPIETMPGSWQGLAIDVLPSAATAAVLR